MTKKYSTASEPSTKLVTVPYREGIDCVREGDRVWVAVYRVCKNLGLDAKTQQRKLKKAAWATTVMMTFVADDGKNREVFCIDLKRLAMWLASVDVERVAPTARPTVAAYQVEAADVLHEYFFGGGVVANPRVVAPTFEEVEGLRAEMVQLRARLARISATTARLGVSVDDLCDAAERADLESSKFHQADCKKMMRLVADHEGTSPRKVEGTVRKEFRQVSYLRLKVGIYVNAVKPWLEARLHELRPKALPPKGATSQQWLPFSVQRGDA